MHRGTIAPYCAPGMNPLSLLLHAQLIGGTWPDNEPAVSCMDWQTGEVNAKYWTINLLAMTGVRESRSISAELSLLACTL